MDIAETRCPSPMLLMPLGTAEPGGSSSLHAVPIEAQLLFIGIIFLGTLIVNKFSIRIGIPAILGVLGLGLIINIHILDVSHAEVDNPVSYTHLTLPTICSV